MKPADPALPDLPRLVMRRAVWVAACAWLLALALGLTRAASDIDQEVAAALSLSAIAAGLSRMATLDDARAIGELERLQRSAPLRHLSLTVHDEQGAVRVAPREPPQASPPVSWLVRLHRTLLPGHTDARAVAWPLARADGRQWRITLAASGESERIEAMENLAGALVVVALGAAALLAAMAVNVKLAFAPMHALLGAIASMRGGKPTALRQLPAMPTQELQKITDALRELGDALESAEEQRRALSRKVATLQEDERQRIARELHDEFGQRLTALRVDAVWLERWLQGRLERRLAGDEPALGVLEGMARQCEHLQHDVRSLVVHLQPPGGGAVDPDGSSSLQQLQQLLEHLVSAWTGSRAQPMHFGLELMAVDGANRSVPWPDAGRAAAIAMAQEKVLALYRISQEALTNAARHSGAGRVRLRLRLTLDPLPSRVEWQACDDGVGLVDCDPALQRGNGLAGMRERLWALGADLTLEAAVPGERPGLLLRASLDLRAEAPRSHDAVVANA